MFQSRLLKNFLAGKAMLALTVGCCLLTLLIAAGLLWKSREILELKPLWELLTSSKWKPSQGHFGFYAFIMGSLWVTVLATLIAVPFSLLTAIYLSEYAGKTVRSLAGPTLDLLSGIPSVVFGIWGVIVFVPLIKDYAAPLFGRFSSGYTVLAAGVVLAVMIAPLIIHVSVAVLRSIPKELREASLSLGATQWQTIKLAVLRKAAPGLSAAVVLGVSRAFGETMAVIMVAGNVAKVPNSLLSPAYPLPALIANNYGEMLSVPLYDSALSLAALVLLAVVLFFNVLARVVLVRVEKGVR